MAPTMGMKRKPPNKRGPQLPGAEGQRSFSLVARKDGFKLTCQDVSFVVGRGKKSKQILKEISMSISAGSVLALIGPSGAGKTTFLNALTMQAFGGVATGDVRLNAEPLTPDVFAKYCYTVEQNDHLWAYLTVEETLLYAAKLFGCLDPTAEVNEVIAEMGLEVCRKTKIGNEFHRGLSGGQKRRLSTAIALLKQPLVLFLDEPTSGLDSTSATEVMKKIVDLSREQNVITICTIHQPPTRVYDTFDLLLLLSTGKDAYFGDADKAISYFSSIGKDIPPNMNPAEFALDLVNRDFVPDEEVDDTMAKWQLNKGQLQYQSEPEKMEKFGMKPPGVFKQFRILLHRQSVLTIRDPTVYVGRAFINMFAAIFFAFVYWKSRTGEQSQVLNKIWGLVSLIGVPCMMAIVGVYGLNAEMLAVKREIRNGMVNPYSYLIVKDILIIPIIFVFGVMNLGIPAFVIQNIDSSTFFAVLAPYCALLFYFESLAEYLAVQFSNYMIGMMCFVSIWFCFFLFGGFLIPPQDMIWPFKFFFYVMPLPYTLRSIVYSHFTTVEWEKCSMPFKNPLNCYSPDLNGTEVLEYASQIYPVIDPVDRRAYNFWIIIAQGMFWRVLFFGTAIWQFSRVAAVQRPKGGTSQTFSSEQIASNYIDDEEKQRREGGGATAQQQQQQQQERQQEQQQQPSEQKLVVSGDETMEVAEKQEGKDLRASV